MLGPRGVISFFSPRLLTVIQNSSPSREGAEVVAEAHTPALALAPQWLHPPTAPSTYGPNHLWLHPLMQQEAPAEGSHLLVFMPTNSILVMPTSQMARPRWDMYH